MASRFVIFIKLYIYFYFYFFVFYSCSSSIHSTTFNLFLYRKMSSLYLFIYLCRRLLFERRKFYCNLFVMVFSCCFCYPLLFNWVIPSCNFNKHCCCFSLEFFSLLLLPFCLFAPFEPYLRDLSIGICVFFCIHHECDFWGEIKTAFLPT